MSRIAVQSILARISLHRHRIRIEPKIGSFFGMDTRGVYSTGKIY